MYLKKMEIAGFKSFAERTKITFDQGVTAIVGPNGSGKSNIVESLRWVLGEQSAKSLRGGKMPDVIFAGTEQRRALNYAEVIATFDNSDHYLTGLHGEDDEVRVTRRLYRNGDSEFLINGRKCRLKDIHELFTDTGLGRDSLSIISQGRIESVFNSKPEERRAIFEEAAGVLKYKSRKTETESKLSATQDNLDRLEDIIYELKGQITPLKAQRDVALRYQELENERVDLALSVLVANLQNEKVKFEQSKGNLTEILSNLTALESQQKAYEAEVSELRQQKNQVEAEQEKLQTENLQLTELKADLQRKIEIFDLQKSSSEKSQKEREMRLSDLTEKIFKLDENLSDLTAKRNDLTEKSADLTKKIEALESQIQEFSENPETLMENLRAKYLDEVNREAQLSNQLTRNKAEIEKIQENELRQDENARENSEKLKQISEEIEAEQAEFDNIQTEIKALLQKFQEKDKEVANITAQEKIASDEMFAHMDQLKNHKARLSSLENIRESHSNLYQGVRAVMQEKSRLTGIIGVVADLLTFDSKYTTAMDIALGGGSQNIITEDENAAKTAINYLRQNRLGRATFLPLTTIRERNISNYDRLLQQKGFIDTALNLVKFDPKLHKAMSSLLATTAIVDNQENATAIARAMNYSVRIVTLDGTQINPGGSYSGGAGRRNNTTFIASEMEQLQEKIVISETQLKASETNLQKLQNNRQTLQQTLEELRQAGEEKRLQEKTLEIALQSKKETKENLLALSNLTGNTEHSVLSDLLKSNENLTSELEKIAENKVKIDAELSEIRANAENINQLRSQKNQALTDLKLEISQIESELRFVKSDEKRVEAEKADLTSEKAKLEAATEEKISDENREIFATQLSETEIKQQQSNVKLVSLRFEREDLQAKIDDLESRHQEFIKENQEFSTQKTRCEMQIEQAENRLRSLQNRLFNDYEMSFDEAVTSATELSDLTQPETQLKYLERQIRALGPINLDAIVQFDEVNSRYEFLDKQKQDLLDAKNLLLDNINEMNDEVKLKFKTTFEQIRTSFQQTFSQMFQGGTADLELTSDDLLLSGVEIKVQPPGKKLASLNLMSGGEKALTALALIFAILRVRTVPFVVLDEVEAALDEANVKRFGDYMNHFDNSNQFIVVTHRRGTMSAAGAMYGVTMADAGISKIISVKFDENN